MEWYQKRHLTLTLWRVRCPLTRTKACAGADCERCGWRSVTDAPPDPQHFESQVHSNRTTKARTGGDASATAGDRCEMRHLPPRRLRDDGRLTVNGCFRHGSLQRPQ